METDSQFLTATMAKVYMGQGYYDKAAEIYRHLLSQEPHRRELADLLAEAQENALQQSRHADRDLLVSLFARWFDLATGCGRLDHLARLRQRVAADK